MRIVLRKNVVCVFYFVKTWFAYIASQKRGVRILLRKNVMCSAFTERIDYKRIQESFVQGYEGRFSAFWRPELSVMMIVSLPFADRNSVLR